MTIYLVYSFYPKLNQAKRIARLAIKDFMHEMMLKELQDLKEKQLQENLKISIQQSKESKVKSRGSFAKYVEDEI